MSTPEQSPVTGPFAVYEDYDGYLHISDGNSRVMLSDNFAYDANNAAKKERMEWIAEALTDCWQAEQTGDNMPFDPVEDIPFDPDPCHEPSGAQLIAQERARQITEEGWTREHDDTHNKAELIAAGRCYAFHAYMQVKYSATKRDKLHVDGWPWEKSWWKPSDDPVRNLVKAGALIAAEIDRLNRPF